LFLGESSPIAGSEGPNASRKQVSAMSLHASDATMDVFMAIAQSKAKETILSLIKDALAWLTPIVALVVSIFVAKTTHGQLQAARETTRTQNLFSLLEYLQRPELHAARHKIHRELAKKPYGSWTEEDHLVAGRVCSSFDFAGVIVRNDMVDSVIFLEFWGEPIHLLGLALDPFMKERNYYWKEFHWLIREARLQKGLFKL